MSHFMPIDPNELPDNVFKSIGQEWMLITVGEPQHYNTMTASWGGWGILWNRKVCFCVIRPQRYTFEFMEKGDVFSLSFFEANYRSALDFCGTHSGRDVDKAAACGLTPYEIQVDGEISKTVTFAEARLVMVCKKIYYQDLDPAHFIDPTIANAYPSRDYHRMYIGEITRCLVHPGQASRSVGMNPKNVRFLSMVLFMIGVISGLVFCAIAVWADFEASLFDSSLKAEEAFPDFRCPIIIGQNQTGIISGQLENNSKYNLKFFIRAHTTDGSIISMSERVDRPLVPAGTSQPIQWEVSRSNAIWGNFILFRAYQYRYAPVPSRASSCGIIISPIPGISGYCSPGLVNWN